MVPANHTNIFLNLNIPIFIFENLKINSNQSLVANIRLYIYCFGDMGSADSVQVSILPTCLLEVFAHHKLFFIQLIFHQHYMHVLEESNRCNLFLTMQLKLA